MSVRTLERPFSVELLLAYTQEPFLPQERAVLERALLFAQQHYADIDHPTRQPYSDYVFHGAEWLAKLGANPLLLAALLLSPPQLYVNPIVGEIEQAFLDQVELVKLVKEILYINSFEWDIWLDYLQMSGAHGDKELLQRMFLLAIGKIKEENHGRDPDHQAMFHFQTKEKQAENIIRMLFVAASDIRALIIKLVDRLCLMKFLKDLPAEEKETLHYKDLAEITLAIYAPIAARLGIWPLKSELEDMSFRLLQPELYHKIARQFSQKKQERKDYISCTIIPRIRAILEANGIRADISGRPKHIYSIYGKMKEKNLAVNEVNLLNDLLGIRIIVETIGDCYLVLSILRREYFWHDEHNIYENKGYRDWIVKPKPNGYQSLHSTILFEGKEVEVQIRTHQMHEIAEYGTGTSHWRYKESKVSRRGRGPKEPGADERRWQEQLTEVRKTWELEQAPVPGQEALAQRWIFVLTPRGHVMALQTGSTVLDFAYRIHSDIGNRYIGANVNSHIVNMGYELKNGEIVEIRFARINKINKGPSPQWLGKLRDEKGTLYYVFARRRRSRRYIRRWLKLHRLGR